MAWDSRRSQPLPTPCAAPQALLHSETPQIHVAIWINTVCNLNKYSLQFGQIQFEQIQFARTVMMEN